MLSRSQKRVVIGAALFVVAVLVIPYVVHINKYQEQIAGALSRALGRRVTIRSVKLQTFPQPGLLLEGLVVDDDPSISAEPMLRAEEVLAVLRVSSLWRGRLEIATLNLEQPSLNLVRSSDGRWNIASLLERARQTPTAPTAKPPETRIRFPYIESHLGRVNLKLGQEKKVFALGEADFALWMASENEWRMRLEARPIRTDANLTDVGTLKVQGSWKRAASLLETPVDFKFWWEGGQLGQMSRLIEGRDRGWRGSLRLSGLVLGTPADLKTVSDLRIDDFRRYDIASGESVSLRVHCDAFYRFAEKQVHDVYCQSPFGSGMMLARGQFNIGPSRSIDFSFAAEEVSADAVALLARHVKKNIPQDINTSGKLSAAFTLIANQENRTWSGMGQTSALRITSSVLTNPVELAPTRWHVIGPGTFQFSPSKAKSARVHAQPSLPLPKRTGFAFEPVALDVGGAAPATFSGWFSREGFATELKGEAELHRLFELGRLVGLPTTTSEVSGTAKGTFRVTGNWTGFAIPVYTGEAQLQKITAKMSGVASPVHISSAHFVANPEGLSLSNAVVQVEGVHSNVQFSGTWTRNCSQEQEPCGLKFVLSADQLNIDELNSLVNPKAQRRTWYAALANSVIGSERQKFPPVYASGHVSVTKLLLKSVLATKTSADVTITPSGFSLSNVSTDVLGGQYVGDISADLTSSKPAYSSSGNLVNIGFASLTALMHDPWASGKLTGSYKGTASGWSYDEITASAAGTASFDWRDGVLHHISLDKGKPLQFRNFSGKVELKNGVLKVAESKLQASKSIYVVSGTASLGRELELKLARDGEPGYSVSGTLEHPKITPVKSPETQAALR